MLLEIQENSPTLCLHLTFYCLITPLCDLAISLLYQLVTRSKNIRTVQQGLAHIPLPNQRSKLGLIKVHFPEYVLTGRNIHAKQVLQHICIHNYKTNLRNASLTFLVCPLFWQCHFYLFGFEISITLFRNTMICSHWSYCFTNMTKYYINMICMPCIQCYLNN